MLYLPDGYSEKDGVWRKHTRAQFRHPQLTRAAAETRRDREYWESRREDYLNSGVDRSSKTFDYLKEDLSLIEKRATYLKEVRREDGAKVLNAEYITSHKLPTLIACPSCGCTNSVSKLRGPIEVNQGVIVK